MRIPQWIAASGYLGGLLAFLVAACGPSAEPTATSPAARSTATSPAVTQPTATKAAVSTVGGTTTPGEVKLRPVPVLAPPQANPSAKPGGVFRWLQNQDPPDFGIWDSAVGTTLQTAVPAYDTLLDTNEYQEGKRDQILSSLAHDWWTNQAGDKWTFKLREGVKFTDGKTLTCADVKFSLETIRDGRDAKGTELRRSPRGRFLARVKEVRCPDDYTAEIVTDGPLPSLIRTLTFTTFAVMPKHVFEGNLKAQLNQVGPGEGPFMYDSYTPTESFKLKRNPNYWQQPYPYLDGFHIINLGSTTAATSAFRTGRGEYFGVPKSVRDQMEAEGKITVIQKEASDSFTAVHTNWTRAPWNDKRFALALRCAIDSGKAIKTVVNGEGYEGPIFPLKEVPGGSEWSLTMEEWKAVHPCHGPSGDEANMEKRRQIARDLLKEMGFGPGNPAKPHAAWWNSGSLPQAWVSIDADLRAVGMEPTMTLNETAVYYDKASAAEFDLTPGGFATSRRDPDHWLYEHYFSTSDRNYGRYSNAEIDALINQQSRTLDPVERKKMINQIDKILLRDNAKLVVYHGFGARAHAIWVKDIYWGMPSNSQSTGSKYSRTWIDQDQMKKVLGQ